MGEIAQDSLPEKERRLLAVLDREPFLIALDGLEHLLVAYAPMDAAALRQEDLDERLIERHPLRQTIDVRVGRFLRRLVRVRASRILITTRLFPADLQMPTGDALPGCFAFFLQGLADEDAIELWRELGARGSREGLLPIFRQCDSHPLVVQSLAREVAGFSEGDFDAWRGANPDFDPFAPSFGEECSAVFVVALRGLTPPERRTLQVLAGFRMPVRAEALRALLIRDPGDGAELRSKPFSTPGELETTLTMLEDRGLLGRERRGGYDLHPIVRGVVWSGLDDGARTGIREAMRAHFEAMPSEGRPEVSRLDDLAPEIEYYNTLIDLGRYDDAFVVFQERLNRATRLRLSANPQRVRLLERLFPEGVEAPPRLTQPSDQRASSLKKSSRPSLPSLGSSAAARRSAPASSWTTSARPLNAAPTLFSLPTP